MDKLLAMTVFVKIADEGSLTAAANKLGKSLPSVVRMLASLESHLQTRLFNRTTRKIALTEEGRIYLEHCRKILLDVVESELELSEEKTIPHGMITLTAPVRFGEMYVAPSVTRFLKKYPDVKINLLLLDRVVNLLDEGIDLAIRIAHLEDSSMVAKSVGLIRQVVCVSPALLDELGYIPQYPKELSDLPCVCFSGISPNSIWHLNDRGKRIDIKVDGNFICNQAKTSVDACIAGLGFGLFYNYQVMPWIDSGKLKIILNQYEPEPQPINLVYPHSRLMATRVRTLVDWFSHDLHSSLHE